MNVFIALFLLLCNHGIIISTVDVNNIENSDSINNYGAVNYFFAMGKYEVTSSEYTEFLNSVAKSSTPAVVGLYNPLMSNSCGINKSGTNGNYVYTVSPGNENKPVNNVSIYDAFKFANWLHHGQSDTANLIDGSYKYYVAESRWRRIADPVWAIPTADEWYKSAYHKNDGDTGNYWTYPTQSNLVPSNEIVSPDAGNNANFLCSTNCIFTDVGEFENSESPYGTYDQGGNVAEWTETWVLNSPDGPYYNFLGGSVMQSEIFLSSSNFNYEVGWFEDASVGFRVINVHHPEPYSIFLLIPFILWWRKSTYS